MFRYDILLYVLGALCLAGAITTTVLYYTQPKTALQQGEHLSANVPNDVAQLFQQWKQENSKLYGEEWIENYRLSVFYENYEWVQRHNLNDEYELGMTPFADLKPAEFQATYLGFKNYKTDYSTCKSTFEKSSNDVPTSVDWRTKGDVSKVKNQGQCGSCWAFSTTGSLESESAIHGKSLGDFSEQQLVDCSKDYGNQGCNGGLMDQAFHYVMDKGIDTEDDYPYEGVDQDCKKDGGDFKISKCTDIPANDCDSLQAAVAQQPVSVAVDAVTWQFYFGGVFPSFLCGKSLDHGVLAVGYNEKNQWIVKNSWGGAWGQKGYITLAKGNTCGICKNASYPSI